MQMSGTGPAVDITLHINHMIRDLSSTFSDPSIYKVSDNLRSENEKAFDPKIVAIGPLHHGEVHLQNMEYHKKRYLKELLERRKELSVDRYVSALKDLEERARRCYAEPIPLGIDDFVQLLLLDGIFIIEFLRKYSEMHPESGDSVDINDPIFRYGHVQSHLLQDFKLFENQLPLFILKELFIMSKIDDDQEEFCSLLWPLESELGNGDRSSLVDNADHLLGLIHSTRCLPFSSTFSCPEYPSNPENIKSATELQESGVIFKKSKVQNCLIAIKLKNKTMKIPLLEISDLTESDFKNMIAYEYYLSDTEQKFYTDYAFFMHCLIHSPRDAQLLRHLGIISNWLGGDEMVYHLMNKLGKNVQVSVKFSYYDVFAKVNRRCRNRWNRWLAMLRHDYFNSPWKFISFLGVIILLLLAIGQFAVAVLSYRNDKSQSKGRPHK